MTQIPIGSSIPITQNVIYAVPSIPVEITAGAVVQSAILPTGPFTNVQNGLIIGRFIRCLSGDTTVILKRHKPGTVVIPPVLTYADKVIADGASNYWRLNESSGTIATDSIGGKNGTISGGVTLNQAGPVDKSMLFDGTSGQIITAVLVTLPVFSTVEYWMKIPTNDTQRGAFALRPAAAFFIGVINNTSQFWLGGGLKTASRIVGDNLWHHIVLIMTDLQATLYVDGTLDVAPSATTHVAQTDTAKIGFDLGSSWWKGNLAEVAIYPLALTPEQIAEHYALKA